MSVVSRTEEEKKSTGARGFKAWALASRPKTLPAAVTPVIVGTAFAVHEGQGALVPAALCLVFALLVQVGTNFANDYHDFTKGADTERRAGPARAVASGWIAPATMKRAYCLVFGIAFMFGLGLVPYGGLWLLIVGAASILSGWAYTAGPRPLAYHGWGDLFVLLFFGVVAVNFTYYVQAGSFAWPVFAVSLAVGGLAVNLLVVNNHRDLETDLEAMKHTLVVRLGRGFAEWQVCALTGWAFLAPVALSATGYGGWWILMPLALLPLGWRLANGLPRARSRRDYQRLLATAALLLASYGVALSAGILLA